jgi:hypothetical protein
LKSDKHLPKTTDKKKPNGVMKNFKQISLKNLTPDKKKTKKPSLLKKKLGKLGKLSKGKNLFGNLKKKLKLKRLTSYG